MSVRIHISKSFNISAVYDDLLLTIEYLLHIIKTCFWWQWLWCFFLQNNKIWWWFIFCLNFPISPCIYSLFFTNFIFNVIFIKTGNDWHTSIADVYYIDNLPNMDRLFSAVKNYSFLSHVLYKNICEYVFIPCYYS